MELLKNYVDTSVEINNAINMVVAKILYAEKVMTDIDTAIDSFDGTNKQADKLLNAYEVASNDADDLTIYHRWITQTVGRVIRMPKDVVDYPEVNTYHKKDAIWKKRKFLEN